MRWLLYDGFLPAAAPHANLLASIPSEWVTAVQHALILNNPMISGLHALSYLPVTSVNARIILDYEPTTGEIAALMSYKNTIAAEVGSRRMVVTRADEGSYTVPLVSRLWEPLAYPLLFPHGTLGWGVVGNIDNIGAVAAHNIDVPTTQMWHYRARLLREPRFQIFGRLANEYAVDMFTRSIECRLNYIHANQRRLQQEDAELMGVDHVERNQDIYLPASFLGSNRWASEQIADSLAIAARLGGPTFFVTFTCNINWPEITSQLRSGQSWTDVPVVVARVFRQKLSSFLRTLKTLFPHIGRPLYIIHCVEFQKRGVPHAHILVKYAYDCTQPADIDSIVSAEVPDDAEDAALVRQFMIHHHPAENRPLSAYCQRQLAGGLRSCRFGYPHPLSEHTTFTDDGRVNYRRRRPGDEMVVPHCLPLLRKYRCHLNFEAAGSSQLFQYLFKYIHKRACLLRSMLCALLTQCSF